MAEAWSAFNDSYLRQLKRPEYWGFTPDQASGSSLLPGSENANPWAGRDTANAKYGQLGGLQTGKIMSTQPSTMEQIKSTMFGDQPNKYQGNTFENLMTAGAEKGGKWLGQQAGDWLTQGNTESSGDIADVLAGVTQGDPTLEIPQIAEGLDSAAMGVGGTAMDIAGGGAVAAAPMLAKLFGANKTTSDAIGAAGTTGMAALQGFVNPVSDVMAIMSLIKLFGGLF